MIESGINIKERDNFFDVVKGIGILSIVIGHAVNTDNFKIEYFEVIRRFVYTYHLAIFFFVSGVFYKKVSFKTAVQNQFKRNYIPYVVIQFLSYILLPVYIYLGVFEKINLFQMAKKMFESIIFLGGGIFTGALWFVPALVGVILIYTAIDIVSSKYKKNVLLKFLFVTFLGIFGIILVRNQALNIYAINKILIFLPLFYIGDIFKLYKNTVISKLSIYSLIITFVAILLLNYISSLQIEVTKGYVYGGYGFYPITFLGILFCLSFSKQLCKSTILKNVFSLIGKKSFNIMAFHFIVFKLIDGFYGYLNGVTNEKILLLFPYSFPGLVLLYVLLGILIPIWIEPFTNKVIVFFQKNLKKVLLLNSKIIL